MNVLSKDRGEKLTEVLSMLLSLLLQHDRCVFKCNSTGASYKLRQLINFIISCQKLPSCLQICNSCYLAIAVAAYKNISGKEKEEMKTNFLSFETCPGPPCSWLRIRRGQISGEYGSPLISFTICLSSFLIPIQSNCPNKKVIFFKEDIGAGYEKNGDIFALWWNW